MSEPDPQSSQAPREFPPDVPDIDRHVRLPSRQVVGLLLMASVPVLAMLGLLGPRQDRVADATPALEVVVEYPARMRVSGHGVLRITATNHSAALLDQVRVLLPARYLDAFAAREVVREATADRVIAVAPLDPGRSRTVQVELLAERFGRHEGALRVLSAEGDTLTIALRTFILP